MQKIKIGDSVWCKDKIRTVEFVCSCPMCRNGLAENIFIQFKGGGYSLAGDLKPEHIPGEQLLFAFMYD